MLNTQKVNKSVNNDKKSPALRRAFMKQFGGGALARTGDTADMRSQKSKLMKQVK